MRAQQAQANHLVLERVGLVIRRDTGDGFYDRFRGRVMFPIRDARGRTIAFGGRVLPQLADDHSGGKYINSPETPLFAKSREFYGLDLAREAIAKEGTAIVMEGYTDCLMAHQNGVENVIAVLGTALGDRHLPVLRRYTDSITLVLDGDEAGRRRANEILELFVAHEVDLRILTLPEERDPCDVIASQGGDAFRRMVSQAVDALEHKLNLESNGLDVHTETHRATQAAERVLATLARAHVGAGVASSTMQLREQQMLTRTAHRFRLPAKDLHARLVDLRRKSRQRPLTSVAVDADATSRATDSTPTQLQDWHFSERELFELVFLDAHLLGSIQGEIEPVAIKTPEARSLYERCLDFWRAGETRLYDRLMLECEDAATKNILLTLDEESRAKANSNTAQRVNDLLRNYRQQTAHSLTPSTESEDHNSDEALASFLSAVRPIQLSEYRKRRQ
jgi:DNA primase